VAVVSISRIQIRRGQKNQGSGLPQLASGELGWAIDTRELFIGNGAVSEGAPAVGNTKILTEYDDIFSLADTYEYRTNDGYLLTGPDSGSPVTRSLQDRLDDTVSVRAFGAKGDGIADDTASIQRAIDQLYLNSATKLNPSSRIVLRLEAGVYNISSSLFVPPYATLAGAGSDKTIIKQAADAPVIRTVNDSSEPGSPADDSSSALENQARNISISGMTLEHTQSNLALYLESCRDSSFENLKIKGVWSAGSSILYSETGIQLDSLSGAVSSSNNSFFNCVIENFSYAVLSDWDIEYNSFTNCEFRNLAYGFELGENMVLGDPGQTVGPSHTTISNSLFENITWNGIAVINGKYNLSSNNRFFVVGTMAGTEQNPVHPVILYKNPTNKSILDYFARTEALISGPNLLTIPYVPEIDGTAMYTLDYEHVQNFGALNNTRLFRLPGVQNQSYELDYTITSNTYRVIRSGVITVIVDAVQNNVEVSDDYDFVGDDTFLDTLDFTAQLRDADNDTEADTIDVRLTSSMPNDDDSVIRFTIKAKKTDTP